VTISHPNDVSSSCETGALWGLSVVMQEADSSGQHSPSAVLNGSSEFLLGYCSKPLHF
jgi:hypothetical protein